MLKKAICFLLLTALLFSLSACAGQEKKEKKTEDLIRELAAVMEGEDLDENGMTITLNHKISLESHRDSQEEKTDTNLVYEGKGSFTFLAEGGQEKRDPLSEKTDYYAILSAGKAYIQNSQEEKFSIRTEELDKLYNESRTIEEQYSISHAVALRSDGQELYASSRTQYENPLEAATSSQGAFAGRISTASLLETLSPTTVNVFMNKLIFMPGYSYAESIIDFSARHFLSESLFKEGDLRSFIREHAISATEKNGVVTVAFSYDAAQISLQMHDLSIEPGTKIKGTMEFDKNSGELLRFQLDLKDYILQQMKAAAPADVSLTPQVETFSIQGEMIHTPPAEMPMEGDFEAYTDASLFIQRLAEQATPMDD